MDDINETANDLKNHKDEMTPLVNKQLKTGDTWCLIDSKWFRLWKRYVGFDYYSNGTAFGGENPGEIDNSTLFNGDSCKLKSHMLEEMDYQLVPKEAWDILVEKFGAKEGQPPIMRKVIESGLYVKQLSVEIYLLDLKLIQENNTIDVFEKQFSKVTTIATLFEEFRRLFKISEDKEFRIITDSNDRLDRKDETLVDSGIRHSQTLIMQLPNEDGTWPTSPSSSSIKYSTSSNSSGNSFKNGYSLRNGTNYYSEEDVEKGLCGLSNLGNTCFMNSAIQCMSNVPSLTKYFLNNEHDNDLNVDNPLGMHGKIALAYAKMIKEIWSGKHSSISPREFKSNVGAFAPRFSGYQQHDSQELLAFLIDGLHEDLNKIIKKPYVELRDAEGRSDELVAEEAWKNHTKRNDSIIVNIFHGLFKSTLVCPDCSRISITFDPFCFLSLPLPVESEITLVCLFIPSDPKEPVTKHQISVYKSGTMKDVCNALSKQVGVNADHLKVADVYNSRFYKVFPDKQSLRNITDRDALHVYDLTLDGENGKTGNVAKVCVRRLESYGSKLTGHPFLIPVPRKATYQMLYKSILRALRRYIKEEHWEEVEMCEDWQKCEIIEEGQTSDGASSDPGTEDSDEEKENKKSKLERFFTVTVINSFGTATMKELKDDNSIIQFSDDKYFAADWDLDSWRKYIVEDWTDKQVDHESTKMMTGRRKGGIKLDQCMKLFTTVEKLGEDDPWYCPTCKEHKQATKKFDLWSLPPVLIIHLKRFSYSRWSRDKIDAMVDFPVTDLDMSEYIINPIKNKCPKEKYTYNLVAVSNHYGGMGGGHYTAYAKNSNTNKWHYFDDSSVTDASEKSVVTKAAYMLFYQRQDLEFHLVGENGQYVPAESAISPRGCASEFLYNNEKNLQEVNGTAMDTS